jgi:hypothetical protein
MGGRWGEAVDRQCGPAPGGRGETTTATGGRGKTNGRWGGRSTAVPEEYTVRRIAVPSPLSYRQERHMTGARQERASASWRPHSQLSSLSSAKKA